LENEPKISRKKIKDLQQDPSNANAGTERGLRMLDDSLAEIGLGRSVVTDKNGYLIAGNKTTERAVDRGFEDAIIVHTTGKQLVVVQRDDLDLLIDDPNNPARKLAYADNRTSEIGLAWDASRIAADIEAGMDLSGLFTDDEMADIMDEAAGALAPDDFNEFDEDIETEYCCPKCGYKWSGRPNPGGEETDESV